jgi:hypothetical protein
MNIPNLVQPHRKLIKEGVVLQDVATLSNSGKSRESLSFFSQTIKQTLTTLNLDSSVINCKLLLFTDLLILVPTSHLLTNIHQGTLKEKIKR